MLENSTTRKKIIPIIIGLKNLPSIFPNFIQIEFKGVNNFEFNKPKTRKIIETTRDQTLNELSFKRGQIAISKKIIKKTIPKILFEFIFFIKCLIY